MRLLVYEGELPKDRAKARYDELAEKMAGTTLAQKAEYDLIANRAIETANLWPAPPIFLLIEARNLLEACRRAVINRFKKTLRKPDLYDSLYEKAAAHFLMEGILPLEDTVDMTRQDFYDVLVEKCVGRDEVQRERLNYLVREVIKAQQKCEETVSCTAAAG